MVSNETQSQVSTPVVVAKVKKQTKTKHDQMIGTYLKQLTHTTNG